MQHAVLALRPAADLEVFVSDLEALIGARVIVRRRPLIADGPTGMMLKFNDNHFEIFVDSSMSEPAAMHTTFHEMGHVIFDRVVRRIDNPRTSAVAKDTEEHFAEAIANCLSLWHELGAYQVTNAAMARRVTREIQPLQRRCFQM